MLDRCGRLACGLASMLLFTALAWGGEPKEAPTTRVPGFATPERAWRGYVESMETGRWGEMYDCLTPAARQERVFECVFGLWFTIKWHDLDRSEDTAMRQIAADFDALSEAHAIDWKQLEKAASDEEAGRQTDEEIDLDEWREDFLRRIKDRRQLFVEVAPIANRVQLLFEKSIESRVEPEDVAEEPEDLGRPRDVKVRADRATAKVTVRMPKGEVLVIAGKRIRYTTDVKFFRRIDGRWYVASETGEPVSAPLRKIDEPDIPYRKQFDMEVGDVLRFELPWGKQIAVWCGAGKMAFAAAEQATASGLKTDLGEAPFKSCDEDSYIRFDSVTTDTRQRVSTYRLFIGRWEFDIVEDLESEDALKVTIRIVERKDDPS